MASSLRTRLFLTVGVVLAGATAVSSLLSRRATLVEVREVVSQPAPSGPSLDQYRSRIQGEIAGGAQVNAVLSAVARDAGCPLVLVAPSKRVIAASREDLTRARVTSAGPDGLLTLELTDGATQRSLALRGAATLPLLDAAGHDLGLLYALPKASDPGTVETGRLPPPWVLTTAAVALIGLVLTFALSRRILLPVGALTAAAERLQRGDLDVQVAVRGDDEIAHLGRTFNRMAAQLAGTERLRRQMVSDVAHELRSPVTNLRCALEAIQDGLAPPDRASIDALHEETLFLQRLIADLEDLALADAGRLRLRTGEVNVDEIIRRAAGAMSSAPGASVVVRVPAGLPPIAGDPDRLEQVVRNLLSNARRHTPPGGAITVGATDEGRSLRITVRDTGSGIAPEHLPHVFDRFYRADRSRARATGGAGLGLAIARELVAAHGGTIAVESAGEGQGATFAIDLPVKGASAARPPAR